MNNQRPNLRIHNDSCLPDHQKLQICQEILSDLIENIFTTYENSQKEHKKKTPAKRSFLSMLSINTSPRPLFLSDFAKAYNLQILRTLDYNHISPNKPCQLKHLQVHKQFVGNLCGYHALYNMFQVCKLIKSQDLSLSPQEIFNPANFWKFHFECTKYLDHFADTHGYDRRCDPWTYRMIRWGDLERDYVKPLTMYNKAFHDLIGSDEKFKISHITFEFQFKKLVYSMESLERMQKEINEFVKSTKNPVHQIKMVMMGITNHWFLLFVHKFKDHIEFWMLDSKNRDYLTWKPEQIDAFLSEENERRKKEGESPLNNFRLWVAHNAMVDSQISVDLLANCFLGSTTLHHFVADSEVKMLQQGFLESFLLDPEANIHNEIARMKEVFNKKAKNEEERGERESLINAGVEFMKSYYTTLKSFLLNDKTKFLYPSTKQVFLDLVSIIYIMIKNSEEKNLGKLAKWFMGMMSNSHLLSECSF